MGGREGVNCAVFIAIGLILDALIIFILYYQISKKSILFNLSNSSSLSIYHFFRFFSIILRPDKNVKKPQITCLYFEECIWEWENGCIIGKDFDIDQGIKKCPNSRRPSRRLGGSPKARRPVEATSTPLMDIYSIALKKPTIKAIFPGRAHYI